MKFISTIYQNWHHFLHNDELKEKIYSIVFESDTRRGKLFDIILIGSITLSVLLVILESMNIFPHSAYLVLRILEYLLTLFFTFEYLARIYCLKQPRKYIFSFFGIVDLLATLPVYMSFFFAGSHYLLVIRAFRLIRIFRIFKLFTFINEGSAQDTDILFLRADTCHVDGNSDVHDRGRRTRLRLQQYSQQYILGYSHNDHRRLWRHHSCHSHWQVHLRSDNADWLYHNSSAYRYSFSHNGERA